MSDVRVGGRRRIDRVLAPDYLDGLSELPADLIVAKRVEADSEDAELAYLAHLLEGRIEVLLAEQSRRAAGSFPAAPETVPNGSPLGPAWSRVFRPRIPDPLPPERHRRRVERLVHDVDLTDVTARSDGELDRVLRTYRAEERKVSDLRGRVQEVARRCADELARRAGAPDESGPTTPDDGLTTPEDGRATPRERAGRFGSPGSPDGAEANGVGPASGASPSAPPSAPPSASPPAGSRAPGGDRR